MDVKAHVLGVAERAKAASRKLAWATTKAKNDALVAMAEAVERHAGTIKEENAKDRGAGKKQGLSSPMLDRLALDNQRIASMAQGLREIAALPDPVGGIEKMVRRPSGIEVGKMRVPIGVIGVIYESRPNVTADAAGLCLKSGNAVILRGGSEAIHTNICLAHILAEAAEGAGIPAGAIQLVETTDRAAVTELVRAQQWVDLVIPRGGKGLIKTVVEESHVPVIKHYEGICHVYVDSDSDLTMAEEICYNAKVQRPAVCNAMETMLVHEQVANAFLPKMLERFAQANVTVRGCAKTMQIVPQIEEAAEEDWSTEYLDLVLSVKVVAGLDEAISHINTYGSAHTDAIVTQDYSKTREFVSRVDSSSVMVNASTRLSDGEVYGLGAEIGISTDKLHARGPMGLEELTTYKWVVYGDGQVRQ